MSHSAVLDMLQRQAEYDSMHGAALMGGARRKKRATRKKRPSRRAGSLMGGVGQYHSLGAGCGMCGCCGGILKENPADTVAKKIAEKELRRQAIRAEADFGPPYDILFSGKNRMNPVELEKFVGEMKNLRPVSAIADWRKRLEEARLKEEGLPASLAKLLKMVEEVKK